MPTARTKPQVMPAVSGTLQITVQLSAEAAGEYLDPPTLAALKAALGTLDPDLDWRYAYTHDAEDGQGAHNWKGRKPAEGSEEAFGDAVVVDDQLGPAMQREVDAQFAKDPEWDAVQGKEKLPPDHEVVAALTDWHAAAGLTSATKDAARARWWAGQMTGRVYVPDEYAGRLAGPERPATLEEALELIHVQAVDPREGGPILDRHRRVLGYWYRYDREGTGETERCVEVHTPTAVLTFVQAQGGALALDAAADNPYHDAGQPQRLRRAEYAMWYQPRDGGSCLTRSVRHAQDRLTVSGTYMGRNDDQTGYRQLVVSNAEPFKDRKGQPVPFPMGPGVVVALKGLPVDSGNLSAGAKPQRHTPTWDVIEPLDPRMFHIPSINKWKTSILEKLDQLWTLSPDTQVSGESKRQSRKPFDRRVAFAAQDAGAFVAWALRSALVLACQIVGDTTYRDVTFQPKFYLDVDAINLEELRVKLTMWEKGALTLVSLLEATPGVSDAAKEAASLKEDASNPDLEAKKAALERLASGGDGGAGA